MEKISKEHLSLAGEYAVASELCKRGIYAQLTLGTRKKTDLLVDTETAMLRIQVKTKQGRAWPLVKGVFGEDIVLVFVDYKNKKDEERPDFYILTSADWENYTKYGWPSGGWKFDNENRPIKVNKQGGIQWKGVNVEPEEISEHKEKWGKIETLCPKKNEN